MGHAAWSDDITQFPHVQIPPIIPFKPFIIAGISPIIRIYQIIRVHSVSTGCTANFHVDAYFDFSPKRKTGSGWFLFIKSKTLCFSSKTNFIKTQFIYFNIWWKWEFTTYKFAAKSLLQEISQWIVFHFKLYVLSVFTFEPYFDWYNLYNFINRYCWWR